jgi:small acid-soluble spore protein K
MFDPNLGGFRMRNKETNFPNQNNNKLEGEPRAKAEFASKRADGTINTHPNVCFITENKALFMRALFYTRNFLRLIYL